MHKEGIAAVERMIKANAIREPCWKDTTLYRKKRKLCATVA